MPVPVTGTQVGAYRLLEQIGEGGMGAVYLAEHAMLGRRAAVKLLHPDYSARSEIVARFFNEARAATAISDPGIVQIFDFGHHIDGTAYIVMELLEGEGLDKRLRNRGPMSPHDALRIIRQVATSLGAAHARGIVHRDLKPENIFVVRDPEVAGGERAKILDFGIAKLQGDRTGWRTETSQVMGTPHYMSPEQCRGAGMVDHRSDIYSLGCVLFVLVTGRPPFVGEGSGDLIAMHLRETPPLASTFNPRVSADLDRLIARCLEKEAILRFSSGGELATAITNLMATQPNGQAAPSTQPPLVAKNATTLSSSSGMLAVPAHSAIPTRADGKRRGPFIVAVTGLLVLAGVVAVVVLGGNGKQPEPVASKAPSEATGDAAVAPVPRVPDPPPADTSLEMTTRVMPIVVGFAKWSGTHAGAACPTPKDLAPAVGGAAKLVDTWGHPFAITCTDQPAQQTIGIVSAGPDSIFGNRDDVASWMLGDAITDLLAGARWTAKAVRSKTQPKASTPAKGIVDADGDGIPDER